ncbi:hypothetical protein [Kribbella endophytica]
MRHSPRLPTTTTHLLTASPTTTPPAGADEYPRPPLPPRTPPQGTAESPARPISPSIRAEDQVAERSEGPGGRVVQDGRGRCQAIAERSEGRGALHH